MYDVFISYASEDREEIASPLARILSQRGVSVWFAEFSLRLGDSLSAAIDKGLRESKYGVVILSPSFFAKHWTVAEMYSLISRENAEGERIILPVWHKIGASEIQQLSPIMADRFAVSSSQGLPHVAGSILNVVAPEFDTHGLGMELRVVVAIIKHEGRFLLVKRRRPEGSLAWQFPSGIIKAWESEALAAEREVLSETSVSCRARSHLGERVHPNTLTRVSYWICDYLSGDAQLADDDENEAIGWFEKSQVLELITSDLYLPLREYILEEPE